MDEDEMQDELAPGDPLQRQLARYARVRLEPDPVAMRAIRSGVMEAAWRRRIEMPEAGELPEAREMPEAGVLAGSSFRRPFAAWTLRRLGGTLLAAVLAGLLVAGTVFASSRAGGPLYGVRLGLETAFLPTAPDARIQAELALAQTRLAEAAQAAAAGDEPALEAALAGYGDMVQSIGRTEGEQANSALAAVATHLDVLRGLQARVPAAALPAIQRALDRSGGAVERLRAESAGHPRGGPPRRGGAGGPGASNRPARSPSPGPVVTKSPPPVTPPTPKPAKSPKAGQTAAPSPASGEPGGT